MIEISKKFVDECSVGAKRDAEALHQTLMTIADAWGVKKYTTEELEGIRKEIDDTIRELGGADAQISRLLGYVKDKE